METTQISFTVSSVNDGPAPFDVIGDDGNGNELRIRFQEAHPGVAEGTIIDVSYTPVAPAPEPDASQPEA